MVDTDRPLLLFLLWNMNQICTVLQKLNRNLENSASWLFSSSTAADATSATSELGKLRSVEVTSVSKLRLSSASKSYNVLPFVYPDGPELAGQQPVIATGARHFDNDMAI